MEDRDGKKPFIIPKTHASTKDVFITEKPDSRNVTELFDDIKTCALEVHFDFRQNGCKSCDTIRNQKLQKLYNEKRIKMKKDQDPIERLAFHLITYRDVALNVATDGLRCEQLTLPLNKYLGNPKDGIHLSRRPDVLLTSSGAQGLYRFGLLVCKVLLGKGYATIPSTTNDQLPAQLYYDHHFCKSQPINKEQRHIDDLLANSLIFCYEHENFELVPHPPQILPIAILWYDLTEKFAPELISSTIMRSTSTPESQHRNGKKTNGRATLKTKTVNLSTKSIPSISNQPIVSPSISKSGTGEQPIQEPTITETSQNSSIIESTKYPSHFMIPYPRLYTNPPLFTSSSVDEQLINTTQSISISRDPRLLRTKREISSSETIPLSPQHLSHERSLSDSSNSSSSIKPWKASSDEPVLITKSTSTIYIPLISSTPLIDPRLKTMKQTRTIFYLEIQAVKRALQQQKRLNHYHDSKNGLAPKTSYTVVPYLVHEVSNEEYERLLNEDQNPYKLHKHSNGIDYSSLYVSVVDCFNFGLSKPQTTNQIYIDLEQNENKLAYEQIEISNDLSHREKQLNSQQIRLRLRERRQRRKQQYISEKKNSRSSSLSPSTPHSKLYITTGRQLLKEHKISAMSPNTHMSSDLLDFFSREYKNENRSHVKHLLAELVGVFMEKYQIEDYQATGINGQHERNNADTTEKHIDDDQIINSVIDMDLESPSPQGLCDHDERFRVPSPTPLLLPPPPPPSLILLPPPPPPPIANELIYARSFLPSLQTLSSKPNKKFDDPDYNDRCQKLVEQLKDYQKKEITSSKIHPTTTTVPTKEAVFEACLGQFQSSSSENSPTDNGHTLIVDEDFQPEGDIILPLVQGSSNRSRDEFVKLLTKEACTSKSSSPTKSQINHIHSYDYHKQRRRRSHDDDNTTTTNNNNNDKKSSSNSHRHYSRSPNDKTRHSKPMHKNVSSTRTVTLVSNRSTITKEISNDKSNIDISTDNQNDSQTEPIIKRIKLDSISSPLNTTSEVNITDEIIPTNLDLKAAITIPTTLDNHDYRRNLNEKRRTVTNTNTILSTTNHSKTKSSRSRSRSKSKDRQHRPSSTNLHNSSSRNSRTSVESNEKSQTYSQSSRSSSSKNNRHRSQQNQNRNKHQHERKRSSDVSNRHHESYTSQLPDRHEFFDETAYQNSASSIFHQHNMNDLGPPSTVHHLQQRQPARHRRFNYNHQSVADHPRFSNPNALPSSAPLTDFTYPKSSTHPRSASPETAERNGNPSYYQHTHIDQNESRNTNASNSFNSKPSVTFERLQILLQNKTKDSSTDYSINKTMKSSPSSIDHDTSVYLPTRKSDRTMQNNNFTSDDTEKLLTMVQRLRY